MARLPSEVKKRLENVIASRYRILIGDANGADKAAQKHFLEKCYENVTVFCSGLTPRNNLGAWPTRCVDVPKQTTGFHFYAAKDREMAREADFGLMIWDGKSPGTILNVLRLVLAGKIAVLFDIPQKKVTTIKTLEAWKEFMSARSLELNTDVKKRATSDEWSAVEDGEQRTLLTSLRESCPEKLGGEISAKSEVSPSLQPPWLYEVATALNEGFARGDATAITDMLDIIARERGISHAVRDTGLEAESLDRSLASNGAPEFATVLKILSSIGLGLEAKVQHKEAGPRNSAQVGAAPPANQ